ncbi:hypothetical protein LDC_2907, partial [sediment metagenome]
MTLANGSTADVDLLTIGADNVSAFIGVRGSDDNVTTDDFGIVLSGVDAGLALMTQQPAAGQTVGSGRSWTTLQASVGSASLVGIDDLTLEVTDFDVLI